MSRLQSAAFGFGIALFFLNIFRIVKLSYVLAVYKQYDPKNRSTKYLKEVNAMPAIFYILLLVEIVRSALSGTLIYAIRKRKYLIVYIWILTQTIYVMFFFIIMPLAAVWYRYVTQILNLIEAWLTFPFYCVAIYIMMLFYAKPAQSE